MRTVHAGLQSPAADRLSSSLQLSLFLVACQIFATLFNSSQPQKKELIADD
jgi:hypothetical protein